MCTQHINTKLITNLIEMMAVDADEEDGDDGDRGDDGVMKAMMLEVMMEVMLTGRRM